MFAPCTAGQNLKKQNDNAKYRFKAMTHVRCFAPIENTDATILILGSMPGKSSLCAGQYYAHPNNLFWRIIGELLGAHLTLLPYQARIGVLLSAGIALWDVLESCTRVTSLDSDIENDSLIANDFASFFSAHPNIAHVYFNGAKAEDCYQKLVRPDMKEKSVTYQRLPSTSPANASIPYAHKLMAWETIVKQNPTINATAVRAG